MNNLKTRLNLIYVPFLLIAVCFITGYSILNYIFIIKLELPVNEDMVNYWLCVGLAWIPVLIWLRPRIKLLVLKDKKGNLPFLYFLTAWAVIALPNVMMQMYLPEAVGQLTVLNRISEVNTKPLTRYYELKQDSIDKTHIGVYRRSAVGGKNSEYLTFYIDVVCPIRDGGATKGLTAGSVGRADSTGVVYGWLGIEFSDNLSNNISDDEKETEYKAFGARADTEFTQKNLEKFVYLDRVPVNDQKKGYLKALKNAGYNATAAPLLFEAKNEAFEARTNGALSRIFMAFGIGALVWLIMILIPRLNRSEITKLPGNALATNIDSIGKFLSVFNYSSNIQITAIIMALNLLVFLVMVFSGLGFMSFESKDLLNWGANFRPLTVTDGQWWRLLTSVFLHQGLMHLFLNMCGLIMAAIFLEPVLGKLKYAVAYLACGIISSGASVWWHPETVSIGASGAIFGLYGVLVALAITNKVGLGSKKPILIFSLIFIGINLVLGLRGGVDNAAHIGGLSFGLVLGFIYSFFLQTPKPPRKRVSAKNHPLEEAADAEPKA